MVSQFNLHIHESQGCFKYLSCILINFKSLAKAFECPLSHFSLVHIKNIFFLKNLFTNFEYLTFVQTLLNLAICITACWNLQMDVKNIIS